MNRTRKSHKTEAPAKKASSAQAPVPSSSDNSSDSLWVEVEGLMYCDFGTNPTSKILGFDMDFTLIKTRSGKTFAQDEHDWVLLYDSIAETLSNYSTEYRVVIFTNQKGVSTGQVGKTAIQRKIKKVVEAVRNYVARKTCTCYGCY